MGENLAINFVGSEEVIKAWMESEGHKENILSGDYKEIGVSILEGNYEGHTTYLVVQMFGTKRGEKEVLQASSSSFLASNTIITSADNNIGLNDFKSIAILSLIKNNKPITLSFLIILLSILITSLYILIYSHLKEDSFGPSLSHHH